MNATTGTKWTLESGRTICRDGVPQVYLARTFKDREVNQYHTTPAEADELAHLVVAALNAYREVSNA
jgi:hypothetical protein